MQLHKQMRAAALMLLSTLGLMLSLGLPLHAHPMGNFSISHYARLQPQTGVVKVNYVLDLAEIPTLTEKQTLDADHNGVISPAEKAAYLAAQTQSLGRGLTLTENGKPAPLRLLDSDLRLSPGAGGLETMKIFQTWQAPLPLHQAAARVAWNDRNYATRTGWKEIVAVPGPGAALQNASVSTLDRSRGLSVYPRDVIPPQDTEAHFTVMPGAMSVAAAPSVQGPARSATPRDAFTQVIARRKLTPGIILFGLLVAFVFGAFHALAPGHGKTMVAAYLVGSRGTPKHAVLLGIIVTVTHTFGVFVLGLVTLFASQYIVPEKLYPVLSVFSGLAVFGVGVWLLTSRLRGAADGHSHSHAPGHDHSHEGPDEIHLHLTDADTEHEYAHAHGLAHSHAHDHTHAHDHSHTHDHDHSHGHGEHLHEHGGHSHGHGPGQHTHDVPEGPVTFKMLLALGVSGGIVPCPSALVVLLSAIALHRVAYGLVLISAFSLGLASVLVGIGLLVVSARRLADRIPASGVLLQRLPIASAAAITLIGIMLVIRALTPGAP